MGGFFSEELIEEIRLANDIVNVISEYVVLKKKGRNYSGLCPFHNEKTPSFMVSPDKQIFHCFGCGAGGNVLSFVMKKENLTFPEAMRMLADKAGISLPEAENNSDSRNSFRERAFEINGLTRQYFHHILTEKEAGQAALDYFTKRGTSREIIDTFELGFALPAWDDLLVFLKNKGYQESEINRLGLSLARDRGNGFYDRFRNRIMFPIKNTQGKVVGFGGRVMDDSLPKYLNSPETEVFNKSHLLFGLNFAVGVIREKDQVIIMEGYMDVISAHQYGIKNAVASLGTALTREQGKLLMRYTHNVVISYDADQAGVAATVRGMDILQELGCQVKVLTIPAGKDPDEFIKNQGPEAFEKLVANAQPLVAYKLDKAMEKFNTIDVEGKLAAVGELLPNLKNMESRMQIEDAIFYISDKLHISPEDIRMEYEKYIHNSQKNYANRDKLAKNRYDNTMSVKTGANKPAETKNPTREKAELGLLRLMIEDKAIFQKVKQEIGLEFFQRPEYTKIINTLAGKLDNNITVEPGELVNIFSNDEPVSQILTSILMKDLAYSDFHKAANDFIRVIQKSDADNEKENLLKQIAAAEKSGDVNLLNQLILKYQKLF